MKAIILAAGVARRLAPLRDHTHKCLFPIGGRSLLTRMLDSLARHGVGDAVVVVGHCQDQVRAEAGAQRGDMRIRNVDNPEYQKGSILSLWRARETLTTSISWFLTRRHRGGRLSVFRGEGPLPRPALCRRMSETGH